MEFGFGLLTGQRRTGEEWREIYDEMVELTRHAESLGFDSVWASEHHFAPDGYLPGVLPTLASLATVTDSITLGTNMLLAPLHDAVRVAEDAAIVSLLADGRLVLGVANGYVDQEFDHFGVDLRERPQRTEETIQIARATWSDGPLGFDPKTHPVGPEATVTPKPETPPQIVLGGTSKPAVRRAAMLADGWCPPEPLSITEIEKRLRYQRRLREVEKLDDAFSIYVLQYCFVGESADAAWEQITESVCYTQRVYDEMKTGERPDELPPERKQRLRDLAILGTPAEVTEQLQAYADALGDDVHMVLRTNHPGVDTDVIKHCHELLADEVFPELP